MTVAAPTIRKTSKSAQRRLAKLDQAEALATSIQARRAERYRRRAALARLGSYEADRQGGWKGVPWARTAGCGRIVTGDAVEIHVRGQGADATAYPVGVSTCSSVWLCPVCAAKIRTRRSVDVRTAATQHVANGGRLLMLTLTVRHRKGDLLAALMDAETEAWRSIQQDSRWRTDVRPLLVGMIRSWEITHGLAPDAAGETVGSWHPHFHVLLFVRPGACDWIERDGWSKVLGWVAGAWASRIEARLGVAPNQHGFDVKELDADAAEYVSKIADETTRADLKGNASRSVHGIIDALADGEAWAVRAWWEYSTATKGRRAIQWSRGLRDHFGMGKELTDDEVMEKAEAGGTCVETVEKRLWWQLIHAEHGEVPPIVRILCHWESQARQFPVNQS